MKIMAPDLGKDKMVGCIYDTRTHQHRFDQAPLERGSLQVALEHDQPDRVVIEIGPTAGWVGDVVRARRTELEAANPSHQAWRRRNVKKSPTARTKAGLQTLREPARPWDQVGPEELWRGELGEELVQYEQLANAIMRIERKLDELAAGRPAVELLRTIPGVGPRLAEAVVAIVDNPHRFQKGKQAASDCGLVPRRFQSGKIDPGPKNRRRHAAVEWDRAPTRVNETRAETRIGGWIDRSTT